MKNPAVSIKRSTQTTERLGKVSVKRGGIWRFISPSRFVETTDEGNIYQIVESFGLVLNSEKDPSKPFILGEAGDYIVFKNNAYSYLSKKTYDLKKRTPNLTKDSIKNSKTLKSDPQLITRILNNL